MKDSEILNSVLDALGINANYLSIKLGYSSPASVYHILNDRNSLSEDMKQRILKAYPNVNYEFMKKATLPVLLDDVGTKNQMNLFSMVPVESKEYEKFQGFMRMPNDINEMKKSILRIEKMLEDLLDKK